ncbi:MAG: gamma-glutamyl-gamma-aminobutyrate hydrolase family protein [Thermoanaerobaculia bacterium]
MTKPLIGIASDISVLAGSSRERASVPMSYIESVLAAGGIPLLIPPQAPNAAEILARIDGLVLVGGNDCDPALFGEEPHPSLTLVDRRRQESDFELARLARELEVPTLGVCLGMQMMNVAAGGTLIQDIPSQFPTEVAHASDPENRSSHPVTIAAGSRLAAVVGAGEHVVKSTHHQAVRDEGRGLRFTATAPDGITEALEDPAHSFYVGIQWHPEDMAGDPAGDQIFRSFVEEARARALRRHGAAISSE